MMRLRRLLSLMGRVIILKLVISVILQVNLYLVDLSGIIPIGPGSDSFVWIGGQEAVGKAFIVKYNNPNFEFSFYGNDAAFNYTLQNGTWYHIAFAYSGGTASSGRRMWVNGVEVAYTSGASSTALNLDANTELRIGGRIANNTNDLHGSLSNFKLYDTALTASEAKTLYDMGRTGSVANPQTLQIASSVNVRGDIYGGCPVFFEVYASGNTGGSAYMNFNQQSVVKGGGWPADPRTAFYAPVSGYYKFDISMMGTYMNGRGTRIEWRINGTKYPDNAAAQMYDYQSAGVSVHLRVSGNTIAYLNVGDWMGIYNSSNDINSLHGKFTGFYLSS